MIRRQKTAKGLVFVLATALLALSFALFAPKGRRVAHGAPAAASGEAPPGPAKAAPAARKGASSEAPIAAAPGASGSARPGGEAAPPGRAGAEAPAEDLTTLPMGAGLPLEVRAALFFVEVTSLDDSKGEFEATTDLRLVWTDLRLAFDANEEPRGFKEYRFSAADKQLEGMWTPKVEVKNVLEGAKPSEHRLRITPGGEVELTTRTTARYKLRVDPARFPFDRQHLALDVVVRENDTDELELQSRHDDVAWSRPASDLGIDGWSASLVDIDYSEVTGWNGDRYGRVRFSLDVDRDPSNTIAPIFIPLVASLLIPLLAIWMNKATEDGFEIDAFELANVAIGGLFSVIALSFAVYSSYTVVAGSDNTVTRLFALNYVSLAGALVVVVVLFRFNLVAKHFGRHVHQELFRFLLWAMPISSLATSVAIIMAARA